MTDPHGHQATTPTGTDTSVPANGFIAAAKAAALTLFLLLAVIALRYSGAGDHISKGSIQALVSGFGLLAPVVHIAVYTLGTTALVPATVFTLIGAVVFGKFLGTIYNLIGATGGAVLSFVAARYLGRDLVMRLVRGKLRGLNIRAERHGFLLICYLRLAYLPFAPLNYAAGLTRIRLLDFLWGSVLGMFPGVFIFTYFLDELMSLKSPADLLTPRLAVPLTLLVASFFLPMLVKRLVPALNSTASPPRT